MIKPWRMPLYVTSSTIWSKKTREIRLGDVTLGILFGLLFAFSVCFHVFLFWFWDLRFNLNREQKKQSLVRSGLDAILLVIRTQIHNKEFQVVTTILKCSRFYLSCAMFCQLLGDWTVSSDSGIIINLSTQSILLYFQSRVSSQLFWNHAIVSRLLRCLMLPLLDAFRCYLYTLVFI